MAIPVVCPGCRKSFQVGDQFAGKSGPCPKCKTIIQVPTKAEEVKVHAPTQFASGGRSVEGKLVTKPISRVHAKFNPTVAVAAGAAVIVTLAAAWAAGRALADSIALRTIGLLIVSPPLALAGYLFIRDEELEPHRGTVLYVRSLAAGLGYVALWGVFAYMANMLPMHEMWTWLFMAPPLVVAGGLAAVGSLELDFGNGVFHYAFYLIATIVLRWAAGMPWLWEAPPGTIM